MNYLVRVCTLWVGLLVISTPAMACGWYGDGEQSDDDAVVVRPLMGGRGEAIDWEDAEALFRRGERLRRGSNGRPDVTRAITWFERAAVLDHIGAQYHLGRIYEQGVGIEVNLERAAAWYRLAASQGDIHSQHHLGEMYLQGRGVPRDPSSAAQWLSASAEQGHAEVMPLLAKLWWQGEGIAQDQTLALMWWRTAAELGHTESRRRYEQYKHELATPALAHAVLESNKRLRHWASREGELGTGRGQIQ